MLRGTSQRKGRVGLGNLGRLAAIEYKGKCYVGNVIDQVSGTTSPKRIRIQHDPFIQGKVVMPGEYCFKEWVDDD